MFNVSALLLDDALKPATPLTNSAINENQLIFNDEVEAYRKYGAKFFGPPCIWDFMPSAKIQRITRKPVGLQVCDVK